MEENNQNDGVGSKISTLEDSLKLFDKECLLEQLDVNLGLVRRNNVSEEQHSQLLKTVDKDLQKLSLFHHPDKAIRQKKSDREVAEAQNLQTALNATRTVLKALTEVFLKDIDVHYKYEFFAKLDIGTLINEKQIDMAINNVLCKISHLSEVKRVNIIGEIRKFLKESRECLRHYLEGRKNEFLRHRDRAFRHLHKCIEGYIMLAKECNLIQEECRVDNDETTRIAIQRIFQESQKEYEILQNLEIVAEGSLNGTFEIFPARFSYDAQHEPVKSKEHEYFVLPFIFYVDVLLMCSVMVDKQSLWQKIKTTLKNWIFYETEEHVDYFEVPALLKAYHLVSNFINKNQYKTQVRSILKNEFDFQTESTIKKVFKKTVKEIELYLAKQFDINSYKEGKSNREQFNERLFELNNSMTEFKEVENNLLKKIELYEEETNEIRKEFFELLGKKEEIAQECRDDVSKCEYSGSEQDIEEHENIVQKNTGENDKLPECGLKNVNNNQTMQIDDIHHRGFSSEQDDSSKEGAKEIYVCSRDQLNKESINGHSAEQVSTEQAENEDYLLKAKSEFPEFNSESETTHLTVNLSTRKLHIPSKHDETSNIHSKEASYNGVQQQQESFNGYPLELVSDESNDADKEESNIKVKSETTECSSESETTYLTVNLSTILIHIPSKHDETSNIHAKEASYYGVQQQQESFNGHPLEQVSDEPNDANKEQSNIKVESETTECSSESETTHLTVNLSTRQLHIPSKHDETSNIHAKEASYNRVQQQQESLNGHPLEHVSDETDEEQS